MKHAQSQPWYLAGNSQRIVTFAFIAIALIAVADSVIIPYLALGYLYLIPLTIAAAFLSRWQAIIIAGICTAFAEEFSNLPDGLQRYPRAAFMFATYLFVTLIVGELARYRRATSKRVTDLEQDLRTLQVAEQELELLINSSAVGMVTVSPEGKILTSNRAAHDIFAVDAGGLIGQPIGQFLPTPPDPTINSPVEHAAMAANGRPFSARVWATTFSSSGTRITALVIESLVPQARS